MNITYFKLDVDINLNDKPWTPTKEFRGVFDGQHHKITGLKVSVAGDYVGLFGQLSNDGRLSNLHVSGDVENTALENYKSAGGICGVHSGVITNCSFREASAEQEQWVELQLNAMEKLFLARTQHPFPVKKQVVLPGRNLLQFPRYMDATMKDP